jgi:hypothetical protein
MEEAIGTKGITPASNENKQASATNPIDSRNAIDNNTTIVIASVFFFTLL